MASAEYGWGPDYILDKLSPAMLNLYMEAAAKRIEGLYGGAKSEEGGSSKSDVLDITAKNDGLLAEFGIGKVGKNARAK